MSDAAAVKKGIAVVRPPSSRMMDPAETNRIHKKVKQHISKGIPHVVIDLGNVDWLNSKGIGMLISCLTSCRDAGGEMVVARPSKRVKSLLMISQVIRLFDTYETVKEAKRALSEMNIREAG
ncbi:anti-sigma factor antagonist [Candidatus Zixiibacteriota bacterium]